MKKALIVIFSLSLINCSVIKNQNNCKSYFDEALKEEVFLESDERPYYLKGDIHLYELIGENLNYPADNPVQGRIIVGLIIDENGDIIQTEIRNKERLDQTALENELLRVLKDLTKWQPASCNEEFVKFKLYKSIEVLKR